jgi:hypothetical protein
LPSCHRWILLKLFGSLTAKALVGFEGFICIPRVGFTYPLVEVYNAYTPADGTPPNNFVDSLAGCTEDITACLEDSLISEAAAAGHDTLTYQRVSHSWVLLSAY